MSIDEIVTDISVKRDWRLGIGFHNPLLFTFVDSAGVAFDVSGYSFSIQIRKNGTTTNIINLIQGTGITNNGALGTVAAFVNVSNSELLRRGDYFWQMKVIHPDGFTYRWYRGTVSATRDDFSGETDTTIDDEIHLTGSTIAATIAIGGGGLSTVSVDGVTIEGDGTPADPLSVVAGVFEAAGAAAAAIVTLRGGVATAGDTLAKLYTLITAVGRPRGGYDASTGVVPGSATNEDGDFWRITVAGTIPGLLSGSTVLAPGDLLISSADGSVNANQFFSIQSNVGQADASVLGLVKLYTDLLASNTDGSVTQAALVTALGLKADLASPALTGNPTAPTQSQSDDSTKLATTEYVRDAVAAVGGDEFLPTLNFVGHTGATTLSQAGECTFIMDDDGTTCYAFIRNVGATTGYWKSSTDAELDNWSGATAFTGLPAGQFPTVFKTGTTAGGNLKYWMFWNPTSNTNEIYLYSSTNRTAWTIENGGVAVITGSATATDWRKNLYNVAVVVIGAAGSEELHILVEGVADSGTYSGYQNSGYAHAPLSAPTFTLPATPQIRNALCPSLYYVTEKNSFVFSCSELLLDLLPGLVYGNTRWGKSVALTEDLTLEANWEKSQIAAPDIETASTANWAADHDIVLTPDASKTYDAMMFYNYAQLNGRQTYIRISTWLDLWNSIPMSGNPTKMNLQYVDRIGIGKQAGNASVTGLPLLMDSNGPISTTALQIRGVAGNAIIRALVSTITFETSGGSTGFLQFNSMAIGQTPTSANPSNIIYAGANVTPSNVYNGGGYYQSTLHKLMIGVASVYRSILHDGNSVVDRTMTAAGTTGAQTINKAFGSVNFAAAATTLVVTNSLVSATSDVRLQVWGATPYYTSVAPGAGSFTITLNVAAAAEVKVSFWVTN